MENVAIIAKIRLTGMFILTGESGKSWIASAHCGSGTGKNFLFPQALQRKQVGHLRMFLGTERYGKFCSPKQIIGTSGLFCPHPLSSCAFRW
jgi:hypothetical protein